MTTRVVSLVPEEFYHVYNRGTDKRIIFTDKADYRRFIELLFLSNSEYLVKFRDAKKATKSVFEFDRGKQLVAISAYCLMPNHFHILLTPLVECGISIFMGKLCTSYSMYFNKRYDRTGSLFQGTFKSQHANSDEYLKYLFSYIHLNPIKLIQSDWKVAGIKDSRVAMQYLDTYKYSSFLDFCEIERAEGRILTPERFPDYFPEKESFKKEIFEWIMFDPTRQL
jgi:putative transposase